MYNEKNKEIIEQMYQNYATGNMTGVLSCFDKDVIWERPGAPAIPFSGTYTGIDEVMKMFATQATTLSIKKFQPDMFCINEDTVVVLGHDEADVIPTGKSYATKWAQVFTLKDEKITNVNVFLDTKTVAEAFQANEKN